MPNSNFKQRKQYIAYKRRAAAHLIVGFVGNRAAAAGNFTVNMYPGGADSATNGTSFPCWIKKGILMGNFEGAGGPCVVTIVQVREGHATSTLTFPASGATNDWYKPQSLVHGYACGLSNYDHQWNIPFRISVRKFHLNTGDRVILAVDRLDTATAVSFAIYFMYSLSF